MADSILGNAKTITIEGAKFLAVAEKDLQKLNNYFAEMKKKIGTKDHCCNWCCVKCA